MLHLNPHRILMPAQILLRDWDLGWVTHLNYIIGHQDKRREKHKIKCREFSLLKSKFTTEIYNLFPPKQKLLLNLGGINVLFIMYRLYLLNKLISLKKEQYVPFLMLQCNLQLTCLCNVPWGICPVSNTQWNFPFINSHCRHTKR